MKIVQEKRASLAQTKAVVTPTDAQISVCITVPANMQVVSINIEAVLPRDLKCEGDTRKRQ